MNMIIYQLMIYNCNNMDLPLIFNISISISITTRVYKSMRTSELYYCMDKFKKKKKRSHEFFF